MCLTFENNFIYFNLKLGQEFCENTLIFEHVIIGSSRLNHLSNNSKKLLDIDFHRLISSLFIDKKSNQTLISICWLQFHCFWRAKTPYQHFGLFSLLKIFAKISIHNWMIANLCNEFQVQRKKIEQKMLFIFVSRKIW